MLIRIQRELLETTSELRANTLWRFLHLRDYIDAQHSLTPWGKVLSSVLSSMPNGSKLEEAGFIAIELLRLDLLTSDNMFPTYTGAPMRGSGM